MVTVLIDDLDIRVLDRDTGKLIRKVVFDPTRDYQPLGPGEAVQFTAEGIGQCVFGRRRGTTNFPVILVFGRQTRCGSAQHGSASPERLNHPGRIRPR